MTILTPERLAEIEALAKKVADITGRQLWLYRPRREIDDWGTIRLGLDGFIVAMARDAGATDEKQKDEHRKHKTDPYEPVGAYIAALDPQTVLALLASHAALQAEVERLRRELAFSEQTSAARWIATKRNLPYAHHFYLGNKSEYGRKFRWEVDDSVTYWVFEGGLSWFCRLAVDGREEWTKQCGTKDEAMRFAEQDSLALTLTPTKENADG